MVEIINLIHPYLLIGLGAALLIVPRWIRIIIAMGLITVGLTNMGNV